MNDTFKLGNRRLHTCEECHNVYLLDPSDPGQTCRRDHEPLTAHCLEVTETWLQFYTGVCHACSRMGKQPLDTIIKCHLCDCPTRELLPHQPI